MTNQEEQQGGWRPSNLAEAWTEFVSELKETDPQRIDDLQACFYGGALALLAIAQNAAATAPKGQASEAVADAMERAEEDTAAFFGHDETPGGVVMLKVLEVDAASADELVAKVRELVPLAPEQEEQIRQMHAARMAQMAKKH